MLAHGALNSPDMSSLSHLTSQIATVLALEKQGPAALQSLEAATASGMAGGSLITIPTAYKR